MERVGDAGDRWERLFVLGIWVALSFVLGFVIMVYGSSIPRLDDAYFVRYLADGGRLSMPWLWEQADLNRFPISRFFMWMSFNVFGGDLRPQMIIGVGLVSMSALVAVTGLRRIRGRQAFTDAVIPIILLHLGHAEVFLWFMLTVHTSIALAGMTILIVYLFCPAWHESGGSTLLAGIALVLLPLQGMVGVLASLMLAPTCALVGWRSWRKPGMPVFRRSGSMLILAGCICAVLIIVYFIGLDFSANENQLGSDVIRAGVSSVQAMIMTMGTIGRRLWPLSAAFLGAVGLAFLLIGVRAIRDVNSMARRQRVAQLLGLCALVLVALGIGWGRQSQGALLDRYGTYMAALYIGVFCSFVASAPLSVRPFLEMSMFFCAAASLMFHAGYGLDIAQARRDATIAFEADVNAGLPMTAVIARHASKWASNEERFGQLVFALKKRDVKPFASIADDPPFLFGLVPLSTVRMEGFDKQGGNLWRGFGRSSRIVVRIAGDESTAAIRFRYQLEGESSATRMRVWIRSGLEPDYIEDIVVNFNPNKERQEDVQTIWIDRRISEVVISPSENCCSMELIAVEWLKQSK